MSANTRIMAVEETAPHFSADVALLCWFIYVATAATTGLCEGPIRRCRAAMLADVCRRHPHTTGEDLHCTGGWLCRIMKVLGQGTRSGSLIHRYRRRTVTDLLPLVQYRARLSGWSLSAFLSQCCLYCWYCRDLSAQSLLSKWKKGGYRYNRAE